MITEDDALIGENVKALRGAVSQEELAKKMRARGHAWKKQTVYAVESGQRQLKVVEARDLLSALGFSPESDFVKLFQSSEDIRLKKQAYSFEIAAEDLMKDSICLVGMQDELMQTIGELAGKQKCSKSTIEYAKSILSKVSMNRLAKEIAAALVIGTGNPMDYEVELKVKQLPEAERMERRAEEWDNIEREPDYLEDA